jgi:hypothetical protein
MNVKKAKVVLESMYSYKKVPLAQYHGPLLKLTPEDIDKIRLYKKDIQICKNRIKEIEERRSTSSSIQLKDVYLRFIRDLLEHISTLREKIRAVKIERMKIQRQEFEAMA